MAAGFDLFGIVGAAGFDACQPRDRRLTSVMPSCGTAIVLGSSFVHLDPHLVRRAVRRLAARLRKAGHRVMVASCRTHQLNFGRLADAAGFGTISPVNGFLLHPDYGPWVRVYEVLLVEGEPFGAVRDASISDQFQPCCKCSTQPCLEGTTDQVGISAAACPIGIEQRQRSTPHRSTPHRSTPHRSTPHRSTPHRPSPQQWPAAEPMSPMTRFAVSALRFMPGFLRFRF